MCAFMRGCKVPHVAAGVLQVVGPQELLHRFSQVVLQDAPDQLVVLPVQGAVNRRQAAVYGRVRHGVAQLPGDTTLKSLNAAQTEQSSKTDAVSLKTSTKPRRSVGDMYNNSKRGKSTLI